MRLPAWLLWAATAVTIVFAEDTSLSRVKRKANEKKIVCYYTNWSVYRPGTAKFSPQNINPYLCTHLIYAFGGLTKDNALKPFDKYQDIEQGGYAKFNGLKTYNKNLKTMVAIGGWNEGSARFSPLVADSERRRELVKNTVKFLRQNHFDGLDLDWEYPSFRDGGKPRDRDNYAALVQELREEFDRESQKTGRPRLLLTMAVPAGIEYIDKGYDIPKLNKYLDWMNILSYDYHSAFEPTVNHHAPLFSLEEDDEYNFDFQLNIDHTVQHYIKLGADRSKLVLGIPTYGRSYTLFNPEATDIGSPADGPGEQGEATREKGYLAYYEICERVKEGGWEIKNPNPEAVGPFAYKGNQWVGYDDEEIARAKAKYVNDNDLGGIMFWSIDNDDFRGKCHGKPYPLIEAAKEALLATSNELVPSRERESSRSTSRSHEVEHTTKTKTRKTRPRAKSTTTTTESARTRTTPAYSTTTPVPPTTPDPGSDFVCKDEGFFPHPRDCKKYFWCLDSGPSSLGIVAHQFTCPSGLVFNKISDSCDYARNVICKTKTEAPPTTTTTTTSKTTTSRSGVITASPPRSTTTTTTTTTTEEPEYEEYEDEEEEDPGTIKELLSLIKKLGGVEQLEKQLNLQDSDEKGKIKPSLYNKFLSGRPGNKYRGAGEESSTTKYVSLFRNRPAGFQTSESDETKTSAKHEKPQYVTIQRNRSTTKAPKEAEEEIEEEEEEIEDEEEEVKETPKTTKSSRRRPSSDVSTEGKEYVTLRRFRNQKEESTTPRYKSILRTRSTTEAPSEESEEVEEDEEKEAEPPQKDKKYSSVIRENKRIVSEVDESKAPSTTSRTSTSSYRRGNHDYLNNLRGRTRSTTQAPTTTSERPSRRPTSQNDRRRFRPETRTTTTSKTDLIEKSTTNSTRNYQFPRRRARPTISTTTEAAAAVEQEDSRVEESKNNKDNPDLPDLADPAVVAIHNLATVSPGPGVSSISTTPIRVFSESPNFTIHVSPVTESSTFSSTFPPSLRPVSTPANVFSTKHTRPFSSSTVRHFSTPSTQYPTRAPSTSFRASSVSPITEETLSTRSEVIIQPRRQDTTVRQRTTTLPTTPKEQIIQPRRLKPFSKVPKPGVVQAVSRPQTQTPPEYEYYDDADIVDDPLADVPPSALKVKVHSDGYIECLDRGNFPHPFSCKKFISCAKMENNELLGWEYTCPKHLSFDPVGGICNWSAGLGCQH